MNANQEKSLQLIRDLLNSMDDATFLREYEAVKCSMGPTIESFLAQRYFSNLLKNREKIQFETLPIEKHCEIKKPSYLSYRGEQSCTYSANDEFYSEQLAA